MIEINNSFIVAWDFLLLRAMNYIYVLSVMIGIIYIYYIY